MLSRAASSLRPLRCMLCRLDAATRAAHIQQHGLAARGSMQGEPVPCRADTSGSPVVHQTCHRKLLDVYHVEQCPQAHS